MPRNGRAARWNPGDCAVPTGGTAREQGTSGVVASGPAQRGLGHYHTKWWNTGVVSENEAVRCAAHAPLAERDLLTSSQAAGLSRTFQVLANDTRLRMVHALARRSELCVGDLAAEVGMRPQAISNQLQRLVDRGIVVSRRDGNFIRYRIDDPCVTELLDLALCLTETPQSPRISAGTAR